MVDDARAVAQRFLLSDSDGQFGAEGTSGGIKDSFVGGGERELGEAIRERRGAQVFVLEIEGLDDAAGGVHRRKIPGTDA